MRDSSWKKQSDISFERSKCLCGEVSHQTCVTASWVQLLVHWMLPAPFPPIYLLKSKVVLAGCGEHNLPMKASGTSVYSVMERLPPPSKRSPRGH